MAKLLSHLNPLLHVEHLNLLSKEVCPGSLEVGVCEGAREEGVGAFGEENGGVGRGLRGEVELVGLVVPASCRSLCE